MGISFVCSEGSGLQLLDCADTVGACSMLPQELGGVVDVNNKASLRCFASSSLILSRWYSGLRYQEYTRRGSLDDPHPLRCTPRWCVMTRVGSFPFRDLQLMNLHQRLLMVSRNIVRGYCFLPDVQFAHFLCSCGSNQADDRPRLKLK